MLPVIQLQILVVSKRSGRGGARELLRSLTLGEKKKKLMLFPCYIGFIKTFKLIYLISSHQWWEKNPHTCRNYSFMLRNNRLGLFTIDPTLTVSGQPVCWFGDIDCLWLSVQVSLSMAPVNIFKHGADEERAETARLVRLLSESWWERLSFALISWFGSFSAVVLRGRHRHRRPGQEHFGPQRDGGSCQRFFVFLLFDVS